MDMFSKWGYEEFVNFSLTYSKTESLNELFPIAALIILVYMEFTKQPIQAIANARYTLSPVICKLSR